MADPAPGRPVEPRSPGPGSPAAPAPVVLVVGDVLVDVVVRHRAPLNPGSDTEATTKLAGGGSGANTAAWLAHLGAAVALVAVVGDDALGARARDDLAAGGVDVTGLHVDPATATGTCVVLVGPDGERTMLPDRAANGRLDAAAVDRAWTAAASGGGRRPAWVHVSGYTLIDPSSRAAGTAALGRARAAGVATSVDASSAAPLAEMGAVSFLGAMGRVDVLFANDDEAAALGGEAAMLGSAAALVVKHGPGGATWTDGRQRVDLAAAPVTVIDTTGAGDALAAGHLAAAVAGAGPAPALAAGIELAGRAVATVGARPG